MNSEEIAALFTRDGRYFCARWGRPIAPVVFGLADESLAIFHSAVSAVLRDIRHPMMETDSEMGANFMVFFVRDWAELDGIPDLADLTGQDDLSTRLAGQQADEYRMFRFDKDGSIRACLTFLNMSGKLAEFHPAALAEATVVRSLLTFACEVTPTPDLAAMLRAAYDPIMPVVAHDASHALRLGARLPG